MKKGIAILGSTGSIGTQTLEVIEAHPKEFEVELLTAFSNAELLKEQAIRHKPSTVVIADETKEAWLRTQLSEYGIKVYGGFDAIGECVAFGNIDIVLTALVGFAGLMPTIRAIEAGKHIALANKETLVVAGEMITALAEKKSVNIYPVDSEHSAIFQCLVGEQDNPIEKIYLTASGGPFRNWSLEKLQHVKKEEALAHPNWSMGAKISIDSATMMNKGLEIIEAKWLFKLSSEQIKVIVHPQSVIHSIVQFCDGSMKAQMGLPDMKIPIMYALSYPARINSGFRRFDFAEYPNLSFEQPDEQVFRNLYLARMAMQAGGIAPCVLNAANEIAVKSFLQGKISFTGITELNDRCLNHMTNIESPDIQQLIDTDLRTRDYAEEVLGNNIISNSSVK